MNIDDGSSTEFDGRQAGARDPLADRLGREAMAERPAFSPELHHRILKRVRGERLFVKSPQRFWPGRWPTIAAAAAILAVSGLIAFWIARSHSAPVPNPPASVVENVLPLPPKAQEPSISAAPASVAVSVNLGGVLSARLFPPEISVSLPTVSISLLSQPPEAQAAPSTTLPGSPDRLLESLLEPMSSAQVALIDVMSPIIRVLIGLLTFDH